MKKTTSYSEAVEALLNMYNTAIEGLKSWHCGPEEEAERQVRYIDLKTDLDTLLKLLGELYDKNK